nr:hypothetical protein [Tanacetum cinerariifolium]
MGIQCYGIQVVSTETEEESSVSQGNKLGNEANKLGDLNARYEDTTGNESDKSADFDFVSQNNGKERKVSNKECLDECVEEIELNVNKQTDSPSVLDHSLNEKNDINVGNKKSYANVAKNSGSYEDNKLFTIPTVITELDNEVMVFDEELVVFDDVLVLRQKKNML